MDDEVLAPQARRERAEQIAAAHAHDEADPRLSWAWWSVLGMAPTCPVTTCSR